MFGFLAKLLGKRSKLTNACPTGRNFEGLVVRFPRGVRDSIDPPRPGRKTYAQRYSETSSVSTSDIRTRIAEREAVGKECGVLYRVLAERGES